MHFSIPRAVHTQQAAKMLGAKNSQISITALVDRVYPPILTSPSLGLGISIFEGAQVNDQQQRNVAACLTYKKKAGGVQVASSID